MKIRVAILDQDQNYQNRVLVALRERYSKRIEVFPCNSKDDVLKTVESFNIKVLAVNKMSDCDLSEVPEEVAIVYLTEMKGEDEFKGKPTICKYQRVKELGNAFYQLGNDYDRIVAEKKEAERKAEEERKRLEEERIAAEKKAEEERLERERIEAEKKAEEERIAAEKKAEEERIAAEKKAEEERIAAEEERKRQEEEQKRLEEERKAEEERIAKLRSNPNIYVFMSSLSREGSTSASICLGKVNASPNKNILYLDFRRFSNVRRFFEVQQTEVTLVDILNKAKRDELTADDVKNAIYTENTMGFDTISNIDAAYELITLGKEGFERIYKAIGEMVKYDAIIINLDSTLDELSLSIIDAANKFIIVGSGLQESNGNIERTTEIIRRYDSENNKTAIEKTKILYNKYAGRNCSTLNLDGVDVIGGFGIIKERTEMKLIESMSKMAVFSQIIE